MKAQSQFQNAYGIVLSRRKHTEIFAFLMCLEIIASCSYLGFISLPPISITTLHIFVVVAAMYFGPWEAMAVSAIFGVASMWKATLTATEIGDIIFSPLLSGRPFASIIMAVVTRLLFAFITGLMFRWFFSKERKNRVLGVSVIAIVSNMIHSALVYICMEVFFNVSSVETSSNFDNALVLNNILMYTITVLLVLFFDRLLFRERVKEFFEVTSEEAGERSHEQKRFSRILVLSVSLICILVCIHFMSRLSYYISENSSYMDEGYLHWIYALLIQFFVGFAAIFILLALFFRWNRDYFSSLTLITNKHAMSVAQSANRSKSTFLFNMSHDIRTPMNAILGYTDIALKHKDNPERVGDCLKKIKTSGGHLLNLINDILEMSRIEAGKMEIVNIPLNINEVSEGIIYMSNALAAPKDITFKTSIGELNNPYVFADELHTNQVIINLISNAVKYTNPGGTVEYSVEQLGDSVDGFANYRIVVVDNGIGMSEEFQKHLFESFAREQSATVSKQEGAGLGLAIVKNIVDLIGGTIQVFSKQGEGSKFIVELPLKTMDEEEIKAFEASKNIDTVSEYETRLKGKRALLVEDNELNREIAVDILEEEGIIVEEASDGSVAVKILERDGPERYDFILMDIQMPIMNGYEATKAIREIYPNMKTPIIALSANAFAEDKEASAAAGMNGHVSKPINIEELFEVLSHSV